MHLLKQMLQLLRNQLYPVREELTKRLNQIKS